MHGMFIYQVLRYQSRSFGVLDTNTVFQNFPDLYQKRNVMDQEIKIQI